MPYYGGYHGFASSSGAGKARIAESTDPEYLTRCATSTQKWMRQAAAANPHLPADVLLSLAAHEDGYTRSAVAKNSACPAEALRLLAGDPDQWVRHFAARHPNCPADLLARFARDTSAKVRSAVARRANCPPEAVRMLAADPDNDVRSAIAKRTDLPTDLVREMAADPHEWVRKAIAERSAALDTEVTDRLVEAGGYDLRYRTRDVNLPLSENALLRLARHEDLSVRLNVADRPNLPTSVLAVLAEDKDVVVRERIVEKHPDLPEDLRTVLGRGRAMSVVLALRNTAGEEWFLAHVDPRVRINGVRAISTTGPTYGRFFADPDETVRAEAVRLGPSHPQAATLVSDPSPRVRKALAAATTDARMLATLARDDSWSVRLAAAGNRLLDGESLGLLARDANRKVKTVAAERFLAAMRAPIR